MNPPRDPVMCVVILEKSCVLRCDLSLYIIFTSVIAALHEWRLRFTVFEYINVRCKFGLSKHAEMFNLIFCLVVGIKKYKTNDLFHTLRLVHN